MGTVVRHVMLLKYHLPVYGNAPHMAQSAKGKKCNDTTRPPDIATKTAFGEAEYLAATSSPGLHKHTCSKILHVNRNGG